MQDEFNTKNTKLIKNILNILKRRSLQIDLQSQLLLDKIRRFNETNFQHLELLQIYQEHNAIYTLIENEIDLLQNAVLFAK